MIGVLFKKGDYHSLSISYVKGKVLQQFEFIFCRKR